MDQDRLRAPPNTGCSSPGSIWQSKGFPLGLLLGFLLGVWQATHPQQTQSSLRVLPKKLECSLSSKHLGKTSQTGETQGQLLPVAELFPKGNRL